MLLNHSGSYYEEYRRGRRPSSARSQSQRRSPSSTTSINAPSTPNNKTRSSSSSCGPGNLRESERLLTDRSAYISFLEVQLERVSAACLTSQGFGDRIEQVQSSVLSVEDRLSNVAKALSLAQNVSLEQDKKVDEAMIQQAERVELIKQASVEAADLVETVHAKLLSLHDTLSENDARYQTDVREIRQSVSTVQEAVMTSASTIESIRTENRAEIANLRSEIKDRWEAHDLLSEQQRQEEKPLSCDCASRIEELEARFQDMSNKWTETHSTIAGTSASQSFASRSQRADSIGGNINNNSMGGAHATESIHQGMHDSANDSSSFTQSQNQTLDLMTARVDRNTAMVNEAVARIGDFMQVLQSSNEDYEDRLAAGREHQRRLLDLLRESKMQEDEENEQQRGSALDARFEDVASNSDDVFLSPERNQRLKSAGTAQSSSIRETTATYSGGRGTGDTGSIGHSGGTESASSRTIDAQVRSTLRHQQRQHHQQQEVLPSPQQHPQQQEDQQWALQRQRPVRSVEPMLQQQQQTQRQQQNVLVEEQLQNRSDRHDDDSLLRGRQLQQQHQPRFASEEELEEFALWRAQLAQHKRQQQQTKERNQSLSNSLQSRGHVKHSEGVYELYEYSDNDEDAEEQLYLHEHEEEEGEEEEESKMRTIYRRHARQQQHRQQEEIESLTSPTGVPSPKVKRKIGTKKKLVKRTSKSKKTNKSNKTSRSKAGSSSVTSSENTTNRRISRASTTTSSFAGRGRRLHNDNAGHTEHHVRSHSLEGGGKRGRSVEQGSSAGGSIGAASNSGPPSPSKALLLSPAQHSGYSPVMTPNQQAAMLLLRQAAIDARGPVIRAGMNRRNGGGGQRGGGSWR